MSTYVYSFRGSDNETTFSTLVGEISFNLDSGITNLNNVEDAVVQVLDDSLLSLMTALNNITPIQMSQLGRQTQDPYPFENLYP
jgi:hypothetical protein